MQRGSKDAAQGWKEITGTNDKLLLKVIFITALGQWWYSLSVTQALRCLRGRKRVEKRADNLFAKLESIRGILDRIAQSQTDKMVRGRADINTLSVCKHVCCQSLKSVLNMFAGYAGVSGGSCSSETLSEGRDCGACWEPRGSNPGGSCLCYDREVCFKNFSGIITCHDWWFVKIMFCKLCRCLFWYIRNTNTSL